MDADRVDGLVIAGLLAWTLVSAPFAAARWVRNRVRVSWRGATVERSDDRWLLVGTRGETGLDKHACLIRNDFRDIRWRARWPAGVWPFASPSPLSRWRRWRRRRSSRPERIIVVGGGSEVAARRALDALGSGYTLKRAENDPFDWVATWRDGKRTRVLVP